MGCGEAVATLTAATIDEAEWTDRVIVSSFQPATPSRPSGRQTVGWPSEPCGDSGANQGPP